MECAGPGNAKHKRRKCHLFFLVFLLFIQTVVETACPITCTCTLQPMKTVACRSSLNGFPLNVPKDVQIISIVPLMGQTPNNILSISAADLSSFINSIRIQIQRSNIQSIAPFTFTKLNNLKSLDLRNNKLKQISKSALMGLTSLVLLDLSDNVGCVFDSDAFSGLPILKTLRLSKIGLSLLGDILTPLTSLEELDIHGNNLFRLRALSFQSLVSLKHLDVTFNDLYAVDEDLKSLMSRLRSLHLDWNPWRCNCALNWMKTLPGKFVAPGYSGGGSVLCEVPAKYRFRDIVNIPDNDMRCMPAKVKSCSGSQIVQEGNRVVFTCNVEGDPFPDVTWVKPDGSNFSHEVLFSTQNTTTISIPITAYSDHNGQWKLIAESYNTSDSKTIDLTILTTTTTTTTATTTTTTTSKPTTQLTKLHSSSSTTTVVSHSTSTSPLKTTGKFSKLTSTKRRGTTTLQRSTSIKPPLTTSRGAKVRPSSSLLNTVKPASSQNGNSNSDKNYIVIIAAAGTGGIVCLVGIAIFAMVVYRTRAKRQIMDVRENSWSEDKNIVLSLYVTGTPPSTATRAIRR